MGYRDELEALRARLHAAEAERDAAREEAERLERALVAGRSATQHAPTPELVASRRERSIRGGEPTAATVINESGRKLAVFWLGYEGQPRSAGTLVPGGRMRVQTYVGHCWRFVDARTGEVLEHVFVSPDQGEPVLVYGGG